MLPSALNARTAVRAIPMAGGSKRVLYFDEKLNCNNRLLLLCKILHANIEVNCNFKDRIYIRITIFIQAGPRIVSKPLHADIPKDAWGA